MSGALPPPAGAACGEGSTPDPGGHHAHQFSPWCGSASGSTVLTSAVATIGRKRANRQNIVKNRPKLPISDAKSQNVAW